MVNEADIKELIEKEIACYRGFKPSKHDLFMAVLQMGVLELDTNLDTKEVSRIIDEGGYADVEARKTETISCKDDIKGGKFYLNTVSGRTCRVQSIDDKEVNYMYFDFGVDMKGAKIEDFIKYFVSLPEADSFND